MSRSRLLLLLLPLTAQAKSRPTPPPSAPLPAADQECFTEVTRILSGDDYEGRGIGTAGLPKAADTIDAWMNGIGLSREGGPRQRFPVTTGVALSAGNALEGATLGTDWTPAGFAQSAKFSGQLAFVGYGISARDVGYDDYAGLDVHGKVVLAMRYEPGEDDEKSVFDGKRPSRFSELRTKAIVAREAGAAALVLVTPANAADDLDKLPPLTTNGPQSNAGIPVLYISRAQADRWLAAGGSPALADLRKQIDGAVKPASKVLNATVTGAIALEPRTAAVENILGVIPGSGALKKEIVVLGAHYDHLGYGGQGSFEPQNHAIHNGADDNASGVAGVLCAAADLAKTPAVGDRRTVVVVAFTAEEIGLGGSAYYVQHPFAGTMAQTAAMVNLDMVGRVRDGKLSILGTDSSPGWKALVDAATGVVPSLSVASGGDGYGPSDHSSFYGEGVPVAHLFSGAHEQYHTSADDFSTLDLARGGEVVALTAELVKQAAIGPRMAYARAVAGAPSVGDSRGYGAYFGSIPDYTAMDSKTGGVKLTGVRAASPAEKAGVQKGDVIVGMAGIDVQNLYDMTYVLREHKPGETIDIVVMRGDANVSMKATLQTRSPEPQKETPHADFSVGQQVGTEAGKVWAPTAGQAVRELMRADEPHLQDLRRITFGGENAEAYWSPDGRKLIFQRTPPGGGCDAQYTMDLDLGGVALVSSGKGRTTCGYYDSPDASTVIYATTERSGESCPVKPDYSKGYTWALYNAYDIVRDDLHGHRTPLLSSPGYDAEATECRKDGRIVFTSTRDGDIELYSAKADGSDVKRLTDNPGYDGGAFFTADCKKLVWRASRPAGDDLTDYERLLSEGLVRPTALELFVANADGSKPRQLTRNGAANFGPYPTPDGKAVIYASNVGANPREFDLWLVDWKGKAERVTTAAGFDGFPMFSPDGKWLVFASNRATAEGQHDTDLYIARWVP